MSRIPYGVPTALATLIALFTASPASAQFQMTRWTADYGGGPLAGGAFSVTGTAGQHDAGTHTGGAFTLQGGFWFGGSAVLAVGDDPQPGGETLALALSVAPNPIRGSGTLQLTLPRAGAVRLALYDVNGRRLAQLADGAFAAGVHALAVRPQDDDGRPLPAGVYFVRLEAGAQAMTRRMLVVR
jgi:hypothetical protein